MENQTKAKDEFISEVLMLCHKYTPQIQLVAPSPIKACEIFYDIKKGFDEIRDVINKMLQTKFEDGDKNRVMMIIFAETLNREIFTVDSFVKIVGKNGLSVYNLFEEYRDFLRDVSFDNFEVGTKNITVKSKKPILELESCWDGPAIKYEDGFGFYKIDGIIVPSKIITESADSKELVIMYLKENAEIRSFILKKVGALKILDLMSAKLLDKKNIYELYETKMLEEKWCVFLRSIDPSTGVCYDEFVDSEIKTVKKALKFIDERQNNP